MEHIVAKSTNGNLVLACISHTPTVAGESLRAKNRWKGRHFCGITALSRRSFGRVEAAFHMTELPWAFGPPIGMKIVPSA